MTCYKHRLIGEINVKRLLIAAAVLALSPAAAMAADLSGSWKLDGNFNDMIKFSITCKLTQTGTTLAGPCVGPQGEALAATGTTDGSKMEIAYDTTYQGSPVHLAYAGDVQADGTAKGTVDTGGPAGTFTLTK